MPIKSNELCCKCYLQTGGPICKLGGCSSGCPQKRDEGKGCLCLDIRNGDPCPYFKPLHPEEHTEETDYDEIINTFF